MRASSTDVFDVRNPSRYSVISILRFRHGGHATSVSDSRVTVRYGMLRVRYSQRNGGNRALVSRQEIRGSSLRNDKFATRQWRRGRREGRGKGRVHLNNSEMPELSESKSIRDIMTGKTAECRAEFCGRRGGFGFCRECPKTLEQSRTTRGSRYGYLNDASRGFVARNI